MKKTLKFLKEEFLEMLPPTIYFFVIFHILFFINSLIASHYQISINSSVIATIGALIVGKAILISDKIKLLNLFKDKTLVHRVLWRVFIYTIMVFIFKYLEELIPLISKYDSLNQANEHVFENIIWPRFWTIQIFLIIFLMIYVFVSELIKTLGKEEFLKLIFNKKTQ